MKRLLIGFSLLCLIVLGFFSCAQSPEKVLAGIKLDVLDDDTSKNPVILINPDKSYNIPTGNVKLYLPTSQGGYSITWESSNSSAIASTGDVASVSESIDVTLTAKATKKEKTATRDYLIHLSGTGNINETFFALTLSHLTITYVSSESLRLQLDENLVLLTSYTPIFVGSSSLNKTISIVWSTSDSSIITNAGIIHKADSDQDAILTATLSINGEIYSSTFKIYLTVKADTLTDQQIIDLAKTGLTLNYNLTDITSDLILPLVYQVSTSKQVTITWSSSNPSVVSSTGTVVRQDTNVEVILTANLTYNTITSGNTKTFTVNVTKLDSEPELTDEAVVIEAKSQLSLGSNLNQVTSNLTLPLTIVLFETKTVSISWSSSNTSVLSNSGVIERQLVDTNITLTATFSYNTSSSITKEFSIVVLKDPKGTYDQVCTEANIDSVIEIKDLFLIGKANNIAYLADISDLDNVKVIQLYYGNNQPAILASWTDLTKSYNVTAKLTTYNNSYELIKPTSQDFIFTPSEAVYSPFATSKHNQTISTIINNLTPVPPYSSSSLFPLSYIGVMGKVRVQGNSSFDTLIVNMNYSEGNISTEDNPSEQLNNAFIVSSYTSQLLKTYDGLTIKLNLVISSYNSTKKAYIVSFFGTEEDIEITDSVTTLAALALTKASQVFQTVYTLTTTIPLLTTFHGVELTYSTSSPYFTPLTGVVTIPEGTLQTVSVHIVASIFPIDDSTDISFDVTSTLPLSTIASVLQLESSQLVRIEGTITSIYNSGSNTSLFIQDSTGGIYIDRVHGESSGYNLLVKGDVIYIQAFTKYEKGSLFINGLHTTRPVITSSSNEPTNYYATPNEELTSSHLGEVSTIVGILKDFSSSDITIYSGSSETKLGIISNSINTSLALESNKGKILTINASLYYDNTKTPSLYLFVLESSQISIGSYSASLPEAIAQLIIQSFTPLTPNAELTQSLVLPSTSLYGAMVTYSSSDEHVITNSGTVIRPSHSSGNADVRLTWSLIYGSLTLSTGTVDFTVLAAEEGQIQTEEVKTTSLYADSMPSIVATASLLHFDDILYKFTNEKDLASAPVTIRNGASNYTFYAATGALGLGTGNGSILTISGNDDLIITKISILRSSNSPAGLLTVKVGSNSIEETDGYYIINSNSFTIQNTTLTNVQVYVDRIDIYSNIETSTIEPKILNSFDSLKPTPSSTLDSNLNLVTTLPYLSTVEWSSSNPSIISNTGVITRPSYKVGVSEVVTLTATIKKYGETTIETLTFDFNVLDIDFDEAKTEIDSIIDLILDEIQPVTTVIEDIALPLTLISSLKYGATIVFSIDPLYSSSIELTSTHIIIHQLDTEKLVKLHYVVDFDGIDSDNGHYLVGDLTFTINEDGAEFVVTGHLMIWEAFAGGGSTSSTYQKTYIVLYNGRNTVINFGSEVYSLQFVSPNATALWSKFRIPASYTLQPGQYMLILATANGASPVKEWPTNFDTSKVVLVTETWSVSAGAGGAIFALTNNDTLITKFTNAEAVASMMTDYSAWATTNQIVDLLGFGSGVSIYEGSKTGTVSKTIGAKRNSEVDTDYNGADFTVSTPDLSYLVITTI
jgi:hypothetical protein